MVRTIHELVDSGAWDIVRSKLKYEADLFGASNANQDGANPFHIACSKETTPQDIIRGMVAIDEENLIIEYSSVTPLHLACEGGSAATVRTLLEFVSDDDDDDLKEYVLEKDNFGFTALHITWRKHFYPDESSYLYGDLNVEETPSEFLNELERIDSPYDLRGSNIRDSWEKTILLLRACTTGTVDGCFENGGQWTVVHSIAHAAALNIEVPCVVLSLALKFFPEQVRWRDKDGNLPLHIISSVSASRGLHPMFIEASDEDELDDQAKLIYKQTAEDPRRMVLDLYPDAAKITNNSGRLPLHIALHHGSSGETAAMFLKAAPKSVNSRDPVTMLFPFMLAACGLEDEDVSRKKERAMLDATYVLLKENPANVQGGIFLTEFEKYLSGKLAEEKRQHAEEKARATEQLAQISEQREKDLAKIALLESQLRKRKHCEDGGC